ncbi:MAG TPA: threonine synthase [Firmicutes bacterium]|nr:threonine synthase [Bacillota bacterium]
MTWQGIIHQYREYLPVSKDTPIVTLLEGNTPLIPADNLVRRAGLPGDTKLFLKYEGLNPTGSFKDRGMTMALSKAVEAGARAVMCASTGNTSASAAAYAARAGIKAIVLIPDGHIALGKLSQALVHGAVVLAIKGNFDAALRMARELTEKYPITLVNSINPYRIEGQKSAAFEICDRLGKAPDILAIPVGNAGNITAYWKGFKQYKEAGRITALPKMWGFQAEGAAPIVLGRPVPNPETIATAIRIGNPASWQGATAARDESGGLITSITDKEILEAYHLLAESEGVFCEPASAASVAGVLKMVRTGRLPAAATIVCVLTGHGLKDPDRAIAESTGPRMAEAAAEAVVDIVLKEIEQ